MVEAGRDLVRWNREMVGHESLGTFLAAPFQGEVIHSIQYDRSVIDLMGHVYPGRPLVVCLNGAITNRASVPVFAGQGVLSGCDVSSLFINDPGVYLTDSLNLAWYAGWEGVDLQADLIRIVSKVAVDAGASGIAFLGGSGGGFASLALSASIPDSLAVVWNPQTNIYEYNREFVEAYIAPAWGTPDRPTAKQRMAGKTHYEVVSLYANGAPNYVLYLQGADDYYHVKLHLTPMLQGKPRVTGFVTDRMYLELGNWAAGHIAPNKDYLGALLPGVFNDAAWLRDFPGIMKHIPVTPR